MTQISKYEIHPAAELFPMMSEAEYAGLKEDIRLHGQNDDVLIWGGLLLDGRNRLRACVELGIEPGWSEISKTIDPVAWVLSHNLHRRHLTTSQRGMVATKLATLLAGDNQHKNEVASIEATSQSEAAKKLNVGRSTVQRAKTVATKAKPEVVAAVEAGDMSLHAALATTQPTDAEKQDRAKAKAAKDKEKADAKAERDRLKAIKEAEKAAAVAEKERVKAEKEAEKAAALTVDGQVKAIKNLIQQHIGKTVRLLDDLNRLKPNRAALNASVKACEGIKTW